MFEIEITQQLKQAAKHLWESKKFSYTKPKLMLGLTPEKHIELRVKGEAAGSIDLPGALDEYIVPILNRALESGNSES